MFRILTILIFCTTMFAGELEVDGNLTVTGTIQSQTIDSLLQVIADLESQIASIGGSGNSEISAKILEVPIQLTSSYQELLFSINELLNEDQDWYRLTFISYDYDDMGESFTCTHHIGVNTGGLFPEVLNTVGLPRSPMEISRVSSGVVEIYTITNGSNSVFIVSDNDPKFGFRSGTCNISSGGYWTGTLTLKFLVESNF